jgi:hypothetical protein
MVKSIIYFVGIIVVGALLGSFLGDAIAQVVPEGPMRAMFLKETAAGLEPTTLKLKVIEATFGFVLRLNIMSVIGIVVAAVLGKKVLP